MNIAKAIIFSLIMIFSLSSCDFLRSMVGKPTSSEIEVARIEKEAREKAKRDSLAAVKAAEEKLAAEKKAAEHSGKVYDKRYYVIVGSFVQHDNADSYAKQLEKLGYEITFFNFKNGFKAVGLYGDDSISAANRKLNELFSVEITPYDIWVYDTATKMHE